MKAIVAVDKNWGIGYNGELLQKISSDMKFFRKMTINRVVIMGRGTYESLPGKQPLKDRVNIVLSTTLQDDRVKICRCLEELMQEIQKYDTEDLCVIGGESVFNLLLPYCSEAFVTKIHHSFPADKYFTNIDQDDSWHLVSESEKQIEDGIVYTYTKYEKLAE